MPRFKLSDEIKKKNFHGQIVAHGKKVGHRKLSIHDRQNASKRIIATTLNIPSVKNAVIDTPTIRVSKSITETQRKRLERSGIRIVPVADMVKRREENVAAFRKMGKPGFSFSGCTTGEKLK